MINTINRFAKNPVNIDISRSTFDRSTSRKTTFNSGKLIPFYIDEVLPGDTFNLKTNFVARMLTPLVPTMDNAFIDFYYFFVPHRLSAEFMTGDSKTWAKICGENTGSSWAVDTETMVPTSYICDRITPQCIGDYMGLPQLEIDNTDINALPLAAYYLIYNEWFRDQNTQAPVYRGAARYTNECLNVNKIHDYFTSCLPAPQKGASVLTPLNGTAPIIPVRPGENLDLLNSLKEKYSLNTVVSDSADLSYKFKELTSTDPNNPLTNLVAQYRLAYDSNYIHGNVRTGINPSSINTPVQEKVMFDNLVADLANATAATVNQIRQSFAIQRMLEKDARGGSRYKEILKSHFNIDYPDSTIQRPEYLGGQRTAINISQVLQNNGVDPTNQNITPLGYTGAFSHTANSDNSFIKSFGEYGLIVGCLCVRTQQSYSQGLPKLFSKLRRFDYYWPSFANIGEQPVLAKELYYVDAEQYYNRIFGYQEAYADYRYSPSLVTGLLSPNSKDLSFRPWSYVNDFSKTPTLNSDFMVQSDKNIGQTLVFEKTKSQFLIDIYIDNKTTRPMPIYSIPGLIDHH